MSDLGLKKWKRHLLVRILVRWHHWAIFFENEQGAAVMVNDKRYRAILNGFLFPKVEEDDIEDIWFQQDGATCHTANVTIDLLRTVFENRIISRNSDANWPPQRCDLTSLEYVLWAAVAVFWMMLLCFILKWKGSILLIKP